MVKVSAVIPTLDEEATLPALLEVLAADEIVVADGGSRDRTIAIAHAYGARVVTAAGGRGPQLAAGAAAATGELLWFVHADTGVSPVAAAAIRAANAEWGCFEVRIEGLRLGVVAAGMNLRARLTGSCTGDMAIWCRRSLYDTVGGWPALAAFEDLAFTDRARASAPWEVLTPPVTTSARRWQAAGTTRTIAWMVALRAAYRLGAPPERLAEVYRRGVRG